MGVELLAGLLGPVTGRWGSDATACGSDLTNDID